MNALYIVIVAAITLTAGYLTYGRHLAKKWGIDPSRKTPAAEFEDGKDFVPSKVGIVFGHQFSTIAGAGPINGPILAAIFGWVPVLLWILLGGVFFGAVHDFSALFASVRHKGESIGNLVDAYLGRTGKRFFLLFIWLFSILITAAFADIAVGTFAATDITKRQDIANAGVASTSLFFCVFAVPFGFFVQKLKPRSIICAAAAVATMTLCLLLGLNLPIYLPKQIWFFIIFGYMFISSVTPIWSIVQPRDYICSFLLFAMMIAAFIGIAAVRPEMNIPAFTSFNVNGSYFFPMMFVTVACGAVSGFHSIAATSTTSKQISNEKHILPVGFGAMLLESFLAVLALVAVGTITVNGKLPAGVSTPPQIFAAGIASFLSQIGLPADLSFSIVCLAISCFLLTSLDSVIRIARLAWVSLFTDDDSGSFFANGYFATIITIVFSYTLAVAGGYANIWPMFGSANQLLASLSLICCAVFLKKTGLDSKALWIPMAIMVAVTFSALSITIYTKARKLSHLDFSFAADGLQLVFAVLLFGMGIFIIALSVLRMKDKAET